jgi:hypothetical protein
MTLFKDSQSFKSLMGDKEVALVITDGSGSDAVGCCTLEHSSFPNSRPNNEGGCRHAATCGSCDKKKEFSLGRLPATFDWEEEGKFVGRNANIQWVVWDTSAAEKCKETSTKEHKEMFCKGVHCHRPAINWAESKGGGTDNALFLFNKNEWASFLMSESSSLPLVNCLPVDAKSARDKCENNLLKRRQGNGGWWERKRMHRPDPGAVERMRKCREGNRRGCDASMGENCIAKKKDVQTFS